MPPFHRPAIAPDESAKMRGELTIFAFCGASTGTLMMSIRNSELVVSVTPLAGVRLV